jgi:hypothetical protein
VLTLATTWLDVHDPPLSRHTAPPFRAIQRLPSVGRTAIAIG